MSVSGIEPTREQAVRIMGGRLSLAEIINEGCLPRLRGEAKSRVADAFSLVTLCLSVDGRCRQAPENIIPGDEDLESLVGYIVTHIKRPGKCVRVITIEVCHVAGASRCDHRLAIRWSKRLSKNCLIAWFSCGITQDPASLDGSRPSL